MSDEDIEKLLGSSVIKRSTVLEMYGPQAALLWLLYKLDIIGIRKVGYSYAQMLVGGHTLEPPPCSIPLSVISVNKEYLQFCPKRLADPEYRLK